MDGRAAGSSPRSRAVLVLCAVTLLAISLLPVGIICLIGVLLIAVPLRRASMR